VTAFICEKYREQETECEKIRRREQKMSGREWKRFDVADKGRGCG